MSFSRTNLVGVRSSPILCLVTFLCLLTTGRPAVAQNTGSILGSVSDTSGAAVAGAKVTARSVQQGLIRTTTTNTSGSYILPALPIGSYTVTVEAAAFEKYANVAVKIDADQNVRVDAALHPGQVTELVTVSTAPPQVDTQDTRNI